MTISELMDKIEAGAYNNPMPYPAKTDPDRAEKMSLYFHGRNRSEAAFRADLEAAFGTKRRKVRDLLWQKAWEHVHSSGYAEVLWWYTEFAEVVGIS